MGLPLGNNVLPISRITSFKNCPFNASELIPGLLETVLSFHDEHHGFWTPCATRLKYAVMVFSVLQ